MFDTEHRLASPPTPLEGELYIGRPYTEFFGTEFFEGVEQALRFSKVQTLPIYNAAGRNYYIPLPEPVGPYDAVQVAGGGNFDLGVRSNQDREDGIVTVDLGEGLKVIMPPSETSGLFTGHTSYYENGEMVSKENINPVGSYTARSARRKIESTQTAAKSLQGADSTVITPMYVGSFEYEVPDQFGEPQTAILMLVPSMGHRFDGQLLIPLKNILNGRGPAPGPQFNEALIDYYEGILSPCFLTIGRGMAETHGLGLVHHQLTPGNTDALVGPGDILMPYITDWDTMTRPGPSDEAKSKALDMSVALKAACLGIRKLSEIDAIEPAIAADLISGTALDLLKGYYMGQKRRYIKPISNVDAVKVALETLDPAEDLDVVESWLA
jgi:hypothetical protein